MSKYIRTKYEICKTSDVKIINDNIAYKEIKINDKKYTAELEIIKQAGTIEELCDAYVCVYNNDNNHDIYYPYVIDTKDMKLTKNNNWYAAIWTDKGLIYVAKMNDKGELELI